MIIDASALVAVVRNEDGADRFFRALSDPLEPKRLSAASYLEAAIVIDGSRSPIASRRFDDTVAAAGITIEPVDREQAEIARAVYRDFGKGSGHPAGLNFGDCFAYALAKSMREPLLFKGDGFSHTDVAIA
jgi:ribonuclease VapC